jgi:hypothetical protein
MPDGFDTLKMIMSSTELAVSYTLTSKRGGSCRRCTRTCVCVSV